MLMTLCLIIIVCNVSIARYMFMKDTPRVSTNAGGQGFPISYIYYNVALHNIIMYHPHVILTGKTGCPMEP